MSLELLPNFRSFYFDANGNPLAGGKLYTYEAGTSTPLTTYADQSGDTPNTNPIILDANGSAVVFITSGVQYKFILEDADGVQLYSQDNTSGVGFSGNIGTGDVVGPAGAVNNQIALYSGTTGKVIKAASGTGFVKSTAGVVSFVTGFDLGTDSTGTLPINRGGTGQTTAQAALDSLLPSQTGLAGKVLKTDGSSATWGDAALPMTVDDTTTVDLELDGSNELTASVKAGSLDNTHLGASAGILFSKMETMAPFYALGTDTNGHVIEVATTVPEIENLVGSTGNIQTQLDGKEPVITTLPVAKGGTGQTTAEAGLNALLPSQGTSSGKFLTTNGTTHSWASVPSNAPTIFGSTGTPRSIVAGTGFTSGASHMSTTAIDQIIFCQGSVASVVCDISANPQMEAHTIIGAKVRFVGKSDTQPVQLDSGNGFKLNGSWVGYDNAILSCFWDGTNYIEEYRNAI